jgi:hypothetical protein
MAYAAAVKEGIEEGVRCGGVGAEDEGSVLSGDRGAMSTFAVAGATTEVAYERAWSIDRETETMYP